MYIGELNYLIVFLLLGDDEAATTSLQHNGKEGCSSDEGGEGDEAVDPMHGT